MTIPLQKTKSKRKSLIVSLITTAISIFGLITTFVTLSYMVTPEKYSFSNRIRGFAPYKNLKKITPNKKTKINLIWAENLSHTIGANGTIPWDVPEDLQFFKDTTGNKPIIMGSKTWESLPKKPLPGRRNIILTRTPEKYANTPKVEAYSSLEQALSYLTGSPEVFVIGGSELYNTVINLPQTKKIFRTVIHETDKTTFGDALPETKLVKAPKIPYHFQARRYIPKYADWNISKNDKGTQYQIQEWHNIRN